MRITIEGKKADISSKRYIELQKWDNKVQKAIGNSQETKTLNVYLKTLEQRVYDYHYQMLKEENIVTGLPVIAFNFSFIFLKQYFII